MYCRIPAYLPAVERLFSLGGRVFSPLRTRLSSEHFEVMVFLHLANWLQRFNVRKTSVTLKVTSTP